MENAATTAPNKDERDSRHLMVFLPHNENVKFAVLSYIADSLKIRGSKVVVLKTDAKVDGGEARYAIVFKVPKDYKFNNAFAVSVSEDKKFTFRFLQVHYKRNSKTFYTLNAMNELIFQETGSREDRKYQIDWEGKYPEKIIYLRQKELRILPTLLVGVVNLDPKFYDATDAADNENSKEG